MATLTNEELAQLRKRISRGQVPVTWLKPEINAALQAIEDFFEDQGRAAIAAATVDHVPMRPHFGFDVWRQAEIAVAAEVMPQLQFANLGADLYDGTLILG